MSEIIGFQDLWSRRNGPKSAKARLALKIEMYERCGGKCFWCNTEMEFPIIYRGGRIPPGAATFEHVLPYSEGGEFTPGKNIELAHARCNNQRHHKQAPFWKKVVRFYRKWTSRYTYRVHVWRAKKYVYIFLWDCWPTGYRRNANERKTGRKFWTQLKAVEKWPWMYLFRSSRLVPRKKTGSKKMSVGRSAVRVRKVPVDERRANP